MTMNKYIGSRYVPLYLGTHDKTKAYEPLSIVSNNTKTKTYTSIKSVPKNTALDNAEYWAQSGYFQDGIIEITPDIAELASFEQPKMTVTKTDDDAEIKLEVADAYNAGSSYGTAYVLNTLTTAGLYIIKPSVCAEVPDAIASSDTPASLSVITYDNDGVTNYMQQINSVDSIYMRTGDGETWETWNLVSTNYIAGKGIELDGNTFNIGVVPDSAKQETIVYITPLDSPKGLIFLLGDGLYNADIGSTTTNPKLTLKPATTNTIGGIKVGAGLTISEDGTLSVTGA